MLLLIDIYANYIGHRNILPQSYIEQMLLRALEMGHPDTMIEVFRLHSQLLYHPSDKVLEGYFNVYLCSEYAKAKVFFDTVRKSKLFKIKREWHHKMIDIAYENGDLKAV